MRLFYEPEKTQNTKGDPKPRKGRRKEKRAFQPIPLGGEKEGKKRSYTIPCFGGKRVAYMSWEEEGRER